MMDGHATLLLFPKEGHKSRKEDICFLPVGLEKMRKTSLCNDDTTTEGFQTLLLLASITTNFPKAI